MQALILRQTKHGENNKILTLLSPNGTLSAILFRAHKICIEPFSFGTFTLKSPTKGKLPSVTSFELIEQFYNLRTDIECLKTATNICKFAEKILMPETPCLDELRFLLNTLHILTQRSSSTETSTLSGPEHKRIGETTKIPNEKKENYSEIEIIFKLKLLSLSGFPLPHTDELKQFHTHIETAPTSRLYQVKSSPSILSKSKQALLIHQQSLGFSP